MFGEQDDKAFFISRIPTIIFYTSKIFILVYIVFFFI